MKTDASVELESKAKALLVSQGFSHKSVRCWFSDGGTCVEVTLNGNGVSFSQLQALSKLFQTNQIDISVEDRESCPTCGPSYETSVLIGKVSLV